MCPHVALCSLDKGHVLQRMKALGNWNTRRVHQASRPSKRRKVSRLFSVHVLHANMTFQRCHFLHAESANLLCGRFHACNALSLGAGITAT